MSLNIGEKWSEIEPENDCVHGAWEHAESGNRVKVSEFEDGTWDAFLNDRLIENYDTREEAVEKIGEIVENRIRD